MEGQDVFMNGTVRNFGGNIESNVDVSFYVDFVDGLVHTWSNRFNTIYSVLPFVVARVYIEQLPWLVCRGSIFGSGA